jgi:putative hydrolase of the HAD superfamily
MIDALSRPPLAAVLFDLDDTLHDDTATYRRAAELVAREVAATRGIEAEALHAAYVAVAERFWHNLSRAQFGTRLGSLRVEMWGEALRAVGLDDESLAEQCAADYNRFRKDELRLWPGVLELLAALRRDGLRLGLVTNGFAETHREKIAQLALEDAFDELFIADEVGMVKPDPKLFRFACERLGVAPEAAAMVGDRYERDICGAAEVGIYTVWLNSRRLTVPEGEPQPDATVGEFSEVEGALRNARKRR